MMFKWLLISFAIGLICGVGGIGALAHNYPWLFVSPEKLLKRIAGFVDAQIAKGKAVGEDWEEAIKLLGRSLRKFKKNG